MPTATKQPIFDAALALPQNDREELAERLWASLEIPGELSKEQIAEIERRCKEIDEGNARMYSAEEAKRLIRERRKV